MRKELEDGKEQNTSDGVSRRRFMTSAGIVVAGSALAGTALAELGKAKEAAPAAPAAPAALPWPWPKLDPMEAGKRAFNYYHQKGG